MTGQVRPRWLAVGLVAALATPGCLSCLNPVPPPSDEARQLCAQFPGPCRAGVYVFLLDGCDPLGCANFRGVRDYLTQLGFVRTYYGQFYHDAAMVQEIIRLRREDPFARFVVVGYEYGSTAARRVVIDAAAAGVEIDMLALLEPKATVADLPPLDGVRRVVVVRSSKWSNKEVADDVVEVVTLPCHWRFGVPTHPVTLDLLAEEVSNIAQLVPYTPADVEAFPPILDDPAPTPRPVVAKRPKSFDEWDFLKPVSRPKPTADGAIEGNIPDRGGRPSSSRITPTE